MFTKPHSLEREKLEPVFQALDTIGQAHGKSIPQVAVNWLLCSDPVVVPIPGAKNVRQATENAGIAGWRLTEQEYEYINQVELSAR